MEPGVCARLFFAENDFLIVINHFKTVNWRVCGFLLIKYNLCDFIQSQHNNKREDHEH